MSGQDIEELRFRDGNAKDYEAVGRLASPVKVNVFKPGLWLSAQRN